MYSPYPQGQAAPQPAPYPQPWAACPPPPVSQQPIQASYPPPPYGAYPAYPAYPAVPAYPYPPAYPPAPAFTQGGRPVKNPQRKAATRTLNRMCLLVLAQLAASILWETLLVTAMTLLGINILADELALSWLSGALVPLSTALPFFLYIVAGHRDTADHLKFQRVGFFTGLLCVLAGLGLSLLANYPAFMLQDLLGRFGYESAASALPYNTQTWAGFALDMAVIAVLVPFLEEFAFRGVLVSALRPYGTGFAIVASGLVFGFAHIDGPNALFATGAGLVFGFLYARTNNLWLTVWIHALNNGLATIGSYSGLFVPESSEIWFNALLTLGPIALGLLALLLLLIFRRGIFTRPPLYDGPPQPLGAGQAAAAVLRAPLLWALAAIVVAYTATQTLL